MLLVPHAPIPQTSAWDKARLRLAELNELIDALITERQQVQHQLDSIVYPVLTLPAEITSHIFVHSLPKDKKPSRHTAPLVLTQICHLWREIALATPALWQSITMNEYREPLKDSQKLLEMWLQRSATLPLYLSFGSSDTLATQSLVDTSLNHHSRWGEIELSSRGDLDAGDKHFPVLRKVKLTGWGEHPHSVRIHNAPMLHEATISATPAFDVQVPWAQLTRLRFETFELAAECLPLLSQCSDLLGHLTHRAIVSQDVFDTFNDPHLTLNGLESLEITFVGSSIVPHLTLPRLRELTLSGYLTRAIEPFRALLSRSHCSLQRLSIVMRKYDDAVKPDTLVLFFHLVPTVTNLRLVIQRSAVHQFITALSSPSILPAMDTLTIDAERVRDEYGALLDVLRSRRANDILKTFALTLRPHEDRESPSSSSPLPESAMTQFRDLAQRGLKSRVQLKGGPWPHVLLDTLT
ncbi:hypothetical protein B0H19DRAFT_1148936 [Mycena capillaripes]|nr:hypothetical protein B0H19DRAFT_1148936 [Mycena capillaripes]